MKKILELRVKIFFMACCATAFSLTSMQQKKAVICTACLDTLALKTDYLHQVQQPLKHKQAITDWSLEQGQCTDCIQQARDKELLISQAKRILLNKGYSVNSPEDRLLKHGLSYLVLNAMCIGMLYYSLYPNIQHVLISCPLITIPIFLYKCFEVCGKIK